MKKSAMRKRILIIAVSVAGAALLVFIGLFVYRTFFRQSAAFATEPNEPAAQASDAAAVVSALTEADLQMMDGRVNILVMGMDSSEERLESEREDFRTDTMLLVTIDFDAGTVDMISTPRDSYVTVTKATGSYYKVNSAAYFGGGQCDSGFKNACDTISGVFGGLPVNYYVGVNMDGLKALVDSMGGVDYDMDIAFTLDGFAFEKGYQHLDGQQVLEYCRVRKGYGTDADRQARQRKMLVAVFKQLASSGQIDNLPQIYQSLSNMIDTNLSFEQICALAVFGAGFDDWDNIGMYTLPGEYQKAYGVSYYLLDQQGKADLVKKIFGVTIGLDEKHDINYVLKDNEHYEDTHSNSNDETDDPEPEESTTPEVTPTETPSEQPSQAPSEVPSEVPSAEPTVEPTAEPAPIPTPGPETSPLPTGTAPTAAPPASTTPVP